MSIFNVLEKIENAIYISRKIPFTNYALIRQDKIISLIEKTRQSLPQEMQQARWVSQENQRIIQEAQVKAGEIIRDAENRSREILKAAREESQKLLDKEELVIKAKQRAEELQALAEEKAREIITSADTEASSVRRSAYAEAEEVKKESDEYALKIISSMENEFSRMLNVFRKIKSQLQTVPDEQMTVVKSQESLQPKDKETPPSPRPVVRESPRENIPSKPMPREIQNQKETAPPKPVVRESPRENIPSKPMPKEIQNQKETAPPKPVVRESPRENIPSKPMPKEIQNQKETAPPKPLPPRAGSTYTRLGTPSRSMPSKPKVKYEHSITSLLKNQNQEDTIKKNLKDEMNRKTREIPIQKETAPIKSEDKKEETETPINLQATIGEYLEERNQSGEVSQPSEEKQEEIHDQNPVENTADAEIQDMNPVSS